ncbi:hypothetical protein DSUL_90064 [Desulfovibrionales bacterium]
MSSFCFAYVCGNYPLASFIPKNLSPRMRPAIPLTRLRCWPAKKYKFTIARTDSRWLVSYIFF